MPQDAVGDVEARCPGPTENIIVLGSEESYDSFWWRMMFICPGFGVAQNSLRPPRWAIADKTTVLYVRTGYSRAELLTLDYLRDNADVNVVRISNLAGLINYINTREIDGEEHLILRMLFLCHGLPGRLALNYSASPSIDLTTSNQTQMNAAGFCAHARVYSYACRTGVSNWWDSYNSVAEAKPENSQAQKMADHLGIPVHAFYPRTLFRQCLRDPADSTSIATAMRTGRVGNEGSVVNISDEHEGLPHAGQGTSAVDWALGRGQEGEGTSEYSLWRKVGGRSLPIAANSPSGLPGTMAVFEPT